MRLQQVSVDESEKALSLLRETAEWLKQSGSSQWSDVLDGEDRHGLVDAVRRGEVFFFHNELDELVGMVAAWQKATAWDQLLWKNHGLQQDAVYIHRLVVRPMYRGQAYGEQLLIALKSKFKASRTEIRLDCLASNAKLLQFYKNNGFKSVGRASDLNGILFELFSFSE